MYNTNSLIMLADFITLSAWFSFLILNNFQQQFYGYNPVMQVRII